MPASSNPPIRINNENNTTVVMCTSDCFLAFLAVLFPPVAVWVKRGICSADSLINFALLCLGYLPGLIHAWYIISKYPDEEIEYQAIENPGNPGNTAGYQHVYHFSNPMNPHVATCPRHQSPAPQPQAQYCTFHSQSPQQQQHQPQHPQQQPQQSPKPQQPYSHYPQQTGPSPGPSNGPPQHAQQQLGPDGLPTYADVVKGDFKVQSQD